LHKREIQINSIFLTELLRSLGDLEEAFYKEILPKHEYKNSRKRCQTQDPYQKELWELENMRNIKIEENDPLMFVSSINNRNVFSKDIWKFRYYEYHFGVSEHYNDFFDLISMMYIEGLKWVTEYYYNGCPSWKWKFPYIQAPFISDIYSYLIKTNFNMNNIKFNIGEPLTPERQLLAVLPSSCANLLPDKYKYLMLHEKSPIIDMYPTEVDLDTMHKDMYWECTPKLPYLDIERIIEATT